MNWLVQIELRQPPVRLLGIRATASRLRRGRCRGRPESRSRRCGTRCSPAARRDRALTLLVSALIWRESYRARPTSLLLEITAKRAKWEWCSRNPGCSRAREHCPGTRRRRSNIQVHTVHQNMRAAGACVSSGQHNIAGQLVLNIHIELLHHALFEVQILRLDGSGERVRRRRRGDDRQE